MGKVPTYKEHVMETLVAACGLLCNKCDAYRGTKAYDYELICKTAEEWAKLNGVPITPEQVWCNGCMTEGGPKCAHCGHGCEIRRCVKDKEFDTCADCAEYPCSKTAMIIENVPGTLAVLEGLKKF